ncbi:MAG: GAF domain-containing protein [Chloroflexi bacterium]|nr:MAG: hypothetical protein CUN54_04775 [Phototrophicales bacterium]RMF78909.1 MAG: GAF domain-containing protein [Chloroflexota bacterium]
MTGNLTSIIQRENARLKDENDTLKEELTSLREFVAILNGLTTAARDLTSDTELLPLLQDIFAKTLNLLNAPDGSLLLLDEDTNELVFVLVQGTLGDQLRNFRIPADEGIAGWVVQNNEAVLVADTRRDHRFSHMIDEKFAFSTQSIAAAPIVGDQKVYGVLEAINRPGDTPFNESDLDLLGLVCRFAGETFADIERLHPET